MKRLVNSLVLFFVVVFFIALSSPSKALGDQAYFSVCGNNTSDICANQILQADCTPPSFLCILNPFCHKYTGYQCCTSFYDNDTGRMAGRGYRECLLGVGPDSGDLLSNFDWPGGCPINWSEEIKCNTDICNGTISC